MAKIPHRIFLTEDEMPTQWYNLRADMKDLPAPMLNPKTLNPATEEDLRPVFCDELAHQELDNETRYIDIPEDVLSFIAERIDSNIRELEGALLKIISLAGISHKQIDINLAEEALR
ncbi:MAG: DnaA/Hda family protein, partial [Oscillospiraceae bacterium]